MPADAPVGLTSGQMRARVLAHEENVRYQRWLETERLQAAAVDEYAPATVTPDDGTEGP